MDAGAPCGLMLPALAFKDSACASDAGDNPTPVLRRGVRDGSTRTASYKEASDTASHDSKGDEATSPLKPGDPLKLIPLLHQISCSLVMLLGMFLLQGCICYAPGVFGFM